MEQNIYQMSLIITGIINLVMGIGLTVARSIARRLEGDIALDTSYSGGAKFLYMLPRIFVR